MKHIHEFKIDDNSYAISHYPGAKGLELFARLSKMAGKPVGLLLTSVMSKAKTPGALMSSIDNEIDMQIVALCIEAIAENIDEKKFVELVLELVNGLHVNNVPMNFDINFQGRIGHLFKVLKEVIAFQFADFIGGLAAAQEKRAAQESQRMSVVTAL